MVCAGVPFGLAACLGAHESDEPLEPLGSHSSAIISGGLAEAIPWAVQVFDVRGNADPLRPRPPPGLKVTLSDGWIGYPSQTRVLTADANLAPLNFDNTTRSFIIERP